ncbi:hypothetical protein H4R27_005437 [Coemansia aciculifera]|nr:hypothetical protein H4R27_005437 [Coemansia aciculifera]
MSKSVSTRDASSTYSIGQGATSQYSSTHSSVSGGGVEATPQKAPGAGEYHELTPELCLRREKLALALVDLGTPLDFEPLMERLGLKGALDDFEKKVGTAFTRSAPRVPIVRPLKQGDGLLEVDYVRYFLVMLKGQKSALEETGLAKQDCEIPYWIMDKQSTPVYKSLLKPDIVFAFDASDAPTFEDLFMVLEAKRESGKNTYRNHIGQLADYALALRECQPTRKFVPVLFLHGCRLDILIFSHRGYFRAPLGPVLYANEWDQNNSFRHKTIGKSLCRLWFLLTLPAHQFGFLFDSQGVPSRLRFSTSGSLATVADAGTAVDDGVVEVGDFINRTAHITGRCTSLYEATYKGERAILKLSYTRTNRLPEGAVYEVLRNYKRPQANGSEHIDSGEHVDIGNLTDSGEVIDSGNQTDISEQGVPNVPEIFLSGNLVEDFDSFRLEFLVMEHCGTPIVEHIRGMRESKDDNVRSQAAAQAELYVKQVTSTLTMVLAAGVLHRDISPGNIAIKDRKAFVIDWGYAKLLGEPSDKGFAMEIAKRWSFDWKVVLPVEGAKDPFTGTPMYMSARLLLKAKTRSIYDELESLLYVILDAFSDRTRAFGRRKKSAKPTVQPPGFTFYSSEVTALTRLSCMQSSKCFLGKFGVVADSTVAPIKMLDDMRRFLFFSGDVHIGGEILEEKDFPRLFDHTAALGFMGEETEGRLFPLVGGDISGIGGGVGGQVGGQVLQSPLPRSKDSNGCPTQIESYSSTSAPAVSQPAASRQTALRLTALRSTGPAPQLTLPSMEQGGSNPVGGNFGSVARGSRAPSASAAHVTPSPSMRVAHPNISANMPLVPSPLSNKLSTAAFELADMPVLRPRTTPDSSAKENEAPRGNTTMYHGNPSKGENKRDADAQAQDAPQNPPKRRRGQAQN